jgi:hypothetical protein
VLFRGSLRRLTHSLGMKWYLSQNNILCKRDEDRMKAVSQKVKKAAQASVLGQKFCNMTSRFSGWSYCLPN